MSGAVSASPPPQASLSSASLKAKLGDRLPVKITFLDNASKMFLVDAEVTAGQLVMRVLEKFSVLNPELVHNYFGLFESKNGSSIDRSLFHDERVAQIVEQGQSENANFKLVFMIRIFQPSILGLESVESCESTSGFLSKMKEPAPPPPSLRGSGRGLNAFNAASAKKAGVGGDVNLFQNYYTPSAVSTTPAPSVDHKDKLVAYLDLAATQSPGLLRLQYIQALFNVITGSISTSEDEAIALGSIHFLIKFINFFNTSTSWSTKFLDNRIVEFIPAKHLKKSKTSVEEWEAKLIEAAHKVAQELGLTCGSDGSDGSDIVTQTLDEKGADIFTGLYRRYMTIIYKSPLNGFGIKYFRVTPRLKKVQEQGKASSATTTATAPVKDSTAGTSIDVSGSEAIVPTAPVASDSSNPAPPSDAPLNIPASSSSSVETSGVNALLLASNSCCWLAVHFLGLSLCDKDRNILSTLYFSVGPPNPDPSAAKSKKAHLDRWGISSKRGYGFVVQVSMPTAKKSSGDDDANRSVSAEASRDRSVSEPKRRMTLSAIDGSDLAPITTSSLSVTILEFTCSSNSSSGDKGVASSGVVERDLCDLVTDYSLSFVKEREYSTIMSETIKAFTTKSSESDASSSAFTSANEKRSRGRIDSGVSNDGDVDGGRRHFFREGVDDENGTSSDISGTISGYDYYNDNNSNYNYNYNNYKYDSSSSSSNNDISNSSNSNNKEQEKDLPFSEEEVSHAAATLIQSRFRGAKGRELVGSMIQDLIASGELEVQFDHFST